MSKYDRQALALERASEDGRYRVVVPSTVVEQMRLACQQSGDQETGGILIGLYTADLTTARIVEATSAPTDSRVSPTRFLRGIRGLLSLLRSRWHHEGHYYLGEWHYHPNAAPLPSRIDREQIAAIANDQRYSSRNPLLLILGGNPTVELEIYAGVHSASDQVLITLNAA